MGCQSVVECRLLAKIIKDVANLNSDVIRNRKNLKIELEADDSVVFFPATHLGEMPDGSQFNSPRKMSTTDKIKRFFFGSNDLSYLNNEASYLILMTTGDSGFHDSTCDVRVLYENEFLYSVEAFGTIAIFDVTATKQTAEKCPTTFNMSPLHSIGNWRPTGRHQHHPGLRDPKSWAVALRSTRSSERKLPRHRG